MNYLIIGASSDVGISYINELKKQNNEECVRIHAHYHSDESLMKLKEIKSEDNFEIITIKADLTSEEELDKMLLSIKEIPDVIVFLPALKFEYMRLKELDVDRIRKQMNLQAYSFLNLMKRFLPDMKKKKSRVLVMLTKYVTDELPPKFMTDYIVSKYALMGAIKAVKAEYENANLKIDYIAPDMMDTKFLDNLDPRIKEMSAVNSPLGRLLTPDDIVPKMIEKTVI